MKTLHITNSLDLGGAEKILFNVVNYQSKKDTVVISLTSKGFYGDALIKKGYKVHYLNMKKNLFIFPKIIKLFFLIKKINPLVIHTWLYHSNLIGGILAKFAGIKKIFWSIHHDFEFSNFNMMIEMKLLTFLSHIVPNKIIFSSYSSKLNHLKNGYKKYDSLVIQNGIDRNKFRKNKSLREKYRAQLKIKDECFLLGNISRYHPIKDHETLFKSLVKLKKSKLNFKCLLIGNGLSKSNIALFKKVKKYKLQKNVILYGQSLEVHKIINALDLNILCSRSECSPLTLIESMSCGVPSISTDVGDAKRIIGKTGWIVNPEDYEALANCILNVSKKKLLLKEKSQKAINEVKKSFSLNKMNMKYKNIYP